MRTTSIVVLALAALAPLALAAPAAAAPGNGAERYDVSGCPPDEEGQPGQPPARFCFTTEGVFHFTETRSGNVHIIDNGTHTFTLTVDGEDIVSGTSRSHTTVPVKEGQVQVEHFRDRFVNTFGDVTCSGSFRYMAVRGEVHKRLLSVSCDGELPDDLSPDPEP